MFGYLQRNVLQTREDLEAVAIIVVPLMILISACRFFNRWLCPLCCGENSKEAKARQKKEEERKFELDEELTDKEKAEDDKSRECGCCSLFCCVCYLL